jgi:hypothetical protein
MAKLWATFVYGNGSWLSYADSKKFMRLGPAGECSLRNFEDETGREIMDI